MPIQMELPFVDAGGNIIPKEVKADFYIKY